MILLENGAIPLQIVMKAPGLAVGTNLIGVVLARWRDAELVVWNVYQSDFDGKYYCEHGHYFKLTEQDGASKAFKKRAQQFMNWE